MDNTMKRLMDTVNPANAKEIFDYLYAKFPDVISGKNFTALKSYSGVFGGVSHRDSFHPLGIYISGWFLPVNNYDRIEVYCGEIFLGNANLGVRRTDVYKNFPFYNEKNPGFDIFIGHHLQEIKSGQPLAIVVKKGNQTIRKEIISVDVYSPDDSISEIKQGISNRKRILAPTLTNRLPMILKFADKMPEYQFITLIEGMENNLEEVYRTCQQKYSLLSSDLNRLSIFMMAKLFLRNHFPENSDVDLNKDERLLFEQEPFLKNSAEIIAEKYNVAEEYSQKYVCTAYKYVTKLLLTIRPEVVLLWNKFGYFHLIFDGLCKKYGIPVIYMESGLLPGTLIFETFGQMGESYPALNSGEFSSLPVTDEELLKAAELRERLYENKLNRWTSSDPSVYKKDEASLVLEQLDKEKPTLLYAGQNDFESGLFPYTEHTKKFHSPVFGSSDEAAVFLGKLAADKGWNLIYKRHPMMQGRLAMELPENIIISDKIDIHDAIDIADVTITILSQTSYVSLIRNKPAVMLGYHQLAHKGIIYEAWDKKQIEESISNAIKDGFTDRQKANFIKHIAQLCKYYLYTDFEDDSVQYGKTMEDLLVFIDHVVADNQSVNYDILCKMNEDTVLVEKGTLKKSSLSEFTLDLNLKEKLKRRNIKYIITNRDFWHIGKKRGSIAEFLSADCTEETFYRNMMYISQIETKDLEAGNWKEQFKKVLLTALKRGPYHFGQFLYRCENLHDEIKNRLFIDDEIQNGFAEALEIMPKQIIEICAKEDKNDLVNVCFLMMKNALNNRDMEKENLVKCIEEIFDDAAVSDRRKSSFYELMFQCGMFTGEYLRQWTRLLMDSTDKDVLNYYGGMEMGWIAFLLPECIYPEYYIEKRKLLAHISAVMGGTYEKKQDNDENRRIALMVTGLHGKNNASTQLEIGLANELSRRGYDVTIFVADTQFINSDNLFPVMPVAKRTNFSTIFRNQHFLMKDNYVEIKYFDETASAEDRYHAYVKAIYEYNPLAILDITNDNAIYNPQLLNDFPVFSIPLNGYSSSASYTCYIARNIDLVKQCNEIYHSVDLDKCYEANLYIPWVIGEEKYGREKYRIKRDDFVMITVGNRLEFELTEEVQQGMRELLDCNRDMKWILVGNINNKFEYLQDLENRKQLIYWGYENNLTALYKMCDIYLDPPRSGGGGSVAGAVQTGLPAVVSKVPSDILPFIGAENAADDWNGELKLVLELYHSKVKRKKLAKSQQASLRSDRFKIENFGGVLERAIKDLKF